MPEASAPLSPGDKYLLSTGAYEGETEGVGEFEGVIDGVGEFEGVLDGVTDADDTYGRTLEPGLFA